MAKQDSAVQLGMFGVPNTLADAHVVAAHTRQLASGETAFVQEHLRWSRGARPRAPRRVRVPDAPAEQALLFDLSS